MAQKTNKKARPGKMFLEGMDSYSDEYERWKKTGIVNRLVGVFELSEAQFNSTVEEKLAAAGLGHYSALYYQSKYDNHPAGDQTVVASGCTVTVRDAYGKVRPVVFVRKEVRITSTDASDESNKQIADMIRLGVLLHELGHADDISKGINYNHADLTMNIVAAEAHAHRFLYKHARLGGYRILLNYFLDDIEAMARSEQDAVRLSAELALRMMDIAGARTWCAERHSAAVMKKELEKSGRLKEAQRFAREEREY